jgi:hypothetical protein
MVEPVIQVFVEKNMFQKVDQMEAMVERVEMLLFKQIRI